jgi:hypothetical protein
MRSSSPREGVALNIVQRQLGHANLGTTSIYLRGIDPEEIITAEESASVTALPLRPGEASAGTAQLTRPSLVQDRRLRLPPFASAIGPHCKRWAAGGVVSRA